MEGNSQKGCMPKHVKLCPFVEDFQKRKSLKVERRHIGENDNKRLHDHKH